MTNKYIPYSTQSITKEDIEAVVSALRSGWLTGGKSVSDFEDSMAAFCGTRYGVAVSNGTAALHSAVHALALNEQDEIIVPAISFVATANAVLYERCKPVFCDVQEDNLLIDTSRIEDLITSRTKAIIAVDYAGQLADYSILNSICQKHGLSLIADACHSLGAESNGSRCGNLADLTTFSFHPVKQITTGEGGMVMTNSEKYCESIRTFRNHQMSRTPAQRQEEKSYSYSIDGLGYNYRLTDLQAALGLSQLSRLTSLIEKRRTIASTYDQAFFSHPLINPLAVGSVEQHAYHLYVVRVPQRDRVFQAMREKGIGVNVHYKPIYLHTLYKNLFNTTAGLCPVAEKTYTSILSLPLYPDLTVEDQEYVIEKLCNIIDAL